MIYSYISITILLRIPTHTHTRIHIPDINLHLVSVTRKPSCMAVTHTTRIHVQK